MRRFLHPIALAVAISCSLLPSGVRAARSDAGVAISIAVSPSTSVRAGATVTITARTSRPVSDIWIFDGHILDINNVAFVASCDSSLGNGFRRCVGHARYAHGTIYLSDPPFHQHKKSTPVQTFIACWNGVDPSECSRPLKVTWRSAAAIASR